MKHCVTLSVCSDHGRGDNDCAPGLTPFKDIEQFMKHHIYRIFWKMLIQMIVVIMTELLVLTFFFARCGTTMRPYTTLLKL